MRDREHPSLPTATPAAPSTSHPTEPGGGRSAGHAGGFPAPHHPPHHRAGIATGELLYLSAILLSTLWAVVLLFVVYPQSPVSAGFDDDDVPVMSLQGNVVTVKRAALEEALASGRYLEASREQADYFEAQRAATLAAVKRDKLFWFVAAAAFPGAGLLLLRVWLRLQRR